MRQPGYVIASGASALGGRSAQLAFEAAQREACGVFFTGYSGAVARQRGRGDRFEIIEGDGRVRATEIRCQWQWTPSPDHPSQDELARALASADRRVPVLLLHGADEAKRQLAERLRRDRHEDVRVLADGDRIAVQRHDD